MRHIVSYITSYLRLATMRSRLGVGALLAFFLLLAAYVLQYLFGYQPCALCLQQRVLWWILLVVCTLSQLSRLGTRRVAPHLLGTRRVTPHLHHLWYHHLCGLLALLLLLASAGLSLYHAGGERGLWNLTLFCDGAGLLPDLKTEELGIEELRELLLARDVVSCEKVSLRLLGLSLAEYNAIFSLLLAGFLSLGFLSLGFLPKPFLPKSGGEREHKRKRSSVTRN